MCGIHAGPSSQVQSHRTPAPTVILVREYRVTRTWWLWIPLPPRSCSYVKAGVLRLPRDAEPASESLPVQDSSLSNKMAGMISSKPCLAVDGSETLALFDNGASVSMIGWSVNQKIRQLSHINRHAKETPRQEGVVGNAVSTFRYAEMELEVGNCKYKTAVVVSAHRKRPFFLLGPILWAHNCDLSLCQKIFMIRKQQLKCIPEHVKPTSQIFSATTRIWSDGQLDDYTGNQIL